MLLTASFLALLAQASVLATAPSPVTGAPVGSQCSESSPVTATSAAGAPSPAATAPESAAAISDLEERIRVRRVRLPVRFLPRTPGGCDDIGPAAVEVLEDGAPAQVEAVGRERLDRVHAVLIDTSQSMRDRLSRATDAAGEYVRSLPADEPALLAAFSDNLILLAPPTADRPALERALERVELGAWTAFNDAMYYTIRYLASLPQRAVLVALTDGCDSASLSIHHRSRVADLAERSHNVTVFPIGIDLPGHCESFAVRIGPADGPASFLESLGRRSGGTLYRIERATALPGIFREIQERLDGEGHVLYRPAPFGEGPRDRADRRTWRKRRVRVRSGVEGCRVVSAGPAHRIEGAHPDGEAGVLDAPEYRERLPLDVGLPLPHGPESDEAPWLRLEPEAIRGRVADILTERGALYADRPYRASGKHRVMANKGERFELRDFELQVPAFGALARLDSPQAVLQHMLELDRAPFVGTGRAGGAPPGLDPAWVHGQTFLEMRRAIGQALFSYPGYREFSGRRARAARLDELRSLVADLVRAGTIDADAAEAPLRAMAAEPYIPEPAHLQRHLAEWLGDVSARALARALEREAVERLLGEPGPDDPRTARLESRWTALRRWFPSPTQIRVVTPLVPALDADRQVVGFYRFVLPTVSDRGAPEDAVPESPLAIRLARWLLGVGLAPGAAGDGIAVHRIDYETVGRRVARRLRREVAHRQPLEGEIRGRPRAVVVTLGGDTDDPGVAIRAYFAPVGSGRADPLCAAVAPEPGAAGAAGPSPLAVALGEAVERAGRACGFAAAPEVKREGSR